MADTRDHAADNARTGEQKIEQQYTFTGKETTSIEAPATACTDELKRTSLMGMTERERKKLFYSQWWNE